MMILTITIFFIAIVTAFGMLSFRAWELRTGRATVSSDTASSVPDLSFRHIEKTMLYLTKYIVQAIILIIAKYWFITTTKTKKWTENKWPRVYRFLRIKEKSQDGTTRSTFLRRAVLESRAKIRRVKEKVRRDHEAKVAQMQALELEKKEE